MGNEERKFYTAGRFVFEFDDRHPLGFVASLDGGQFKSDPVTYVQGGDFYPTKYAGRAKFDDITVGVGAVMSPTFWRWVSSSLAGKPERRNGALVGLDSDYRERSRRSFYNAIIAEIGFPALDGASRNAATITVKMTPEFIKWEPGDGSSTRAQQAKDQMQKQKMWIPSNFRFQLDRFKNDSLRNCKIDAFTVKQHVIDNPVGSEKWARKAVGRLELPSLVVTFPEGEVEPWMKWYETAVVEGNRKDQYTTGAIVYWTADQRELMRLELGGVSLQSLEIDKYEAGKEGIAQAKATLNVEMMTLKTGPGTV